MRLLGRSKVLREEAKDLAERAGATAMASGMMVARKRFERGNLYTKQVRKEVAGPLKFNRSSIAGMSALSASLAPITGSGGSLETERLENGTVAKDD